MLWAQMFVGSLQRINTFIDGDLKKQRKEHGW